MILPLYGPTSGGGPEKGQNIQQVDCRDASE